MNIDLWAAVATALTALLAAGGAAFVIWSSRNARAQQEDLEKQLRVMFLNRRPSKAKESLDAKIAKAHQLSEQAAKLNAEVKSEFDLQFAAAKKAKSDAETARREANDAEAVKKQYDAAIEAARGVISTELEGVVTRNTKAERRFQIIVAVISFLAGVVTTTIVSLILQAVAG
ncbi:hypothetical protein [Microbacterium sp. NPDC089695]|uniref:hypothetical protein n=1 Tax=Microbacterium sp. NPDC089695 TaxID=3364198 RepID=UPI0038160902